MIHNKYIKSTLLLVCSILFLHSCVTTKQTNLLQNKKPIYGTKAFENYRLQANDEIYCTVLTSDTELANAFNGILTSTNTNDGGGNTNNSGTSKSSYPIYENGYVSIPFFGDIRVIGQTITEAEQTIQRVMKLSTPDAQVRVRLKNNLFYVVSDELNGNYNIYKDNMTIYQALAIAGRPSDYTDYGKVKIVRTDKDGKSTVKVFDLRTESVIESEYYYIKPNDVIYCSTSKGSFFRVRSLASLLTTIITPIIFTVSMFAIDF